MSAIPEIKLSGKHVTQLHDALKNDVDGIVQSLKVGASRIFNGTTSPVVFFVYNYVDSAYWVAAQRTTVAPGKGGDVAASGNRFKIHPNDDKKLEFLVEPGGVYLYAGPGDIERIK